MTILAIESSCDETAASLIEVADDGVITTLRTNIVASQIEIHAQYGGVVPEVAARNHVLTLISVLSEGLQGARPEAIAVTGGPGLITSLLVGVEAARALAYAWDVPLIRVNHLAGHIYANLYDITEPIEYPAICLLVSGGHTELVLLPSEGEFQVIGATRDDAVGEVFDKVGKMLGLGYPGGPLVSKKAANGNAQAFVLPRPMLDSGDLDFSFSGLKTAVRYAIRDYKKEQGVDEVLPEAIIADLCASFQEAVIDTLVAKTLVAARRLKVKTLLFGGGVMANSALRERLTSVLPKELPALRFSMPSLQVCTDNAAMIAAAASVQVRNNGLSGDWRAVKADPQWEFNRG